MLALNALFFLNKIFSIPYCFYFSLSQPAAVSSLSQFVLKHRPMWSLREAAYCVGTLNPHKEEGVRLVMEMLQQVVKLHPGLETLHIGADEVGREF